MAVKDCLAEFKGVMRKLSSEKVTYIFSFTRIERTNFF